jgi:hypothetical protein
MLKDIIYDHAYTLDKGHKFLRELEKLGFTLNEQTVEHPGKAFCRFIMFSDPKRNQRQYLEFVDVRGKNQERKRQSPGLSFRFLKNLESYYKKLRKKPDFDQNSIIKIISGRKTAGIGFRVGILSILIPFPRKASIRGSPSMSLPLIEKNLQRKVLTPTGLTRSAPLKSPSLQK